MPIDSATLQSIINLGLGGLGGGFGNRPQTSTSSYTSTPILTPQQTSIFGPLANAYTNLLGQSTDLSGYQAGQANTIASNSDILKKQAMETLASKGVTSGPAAAATATNIDSDRIRQLNELSQQMPLLQNQLTQQALGLGTNIFRSLPGGSTTSGATVKPGNVLGGIFGNINSGDLTGLITKLIPFLGGLFGGGGNNYPGGGSNTGAPNLDGIDLSGIIQMLANNGMGGLDGSLLGTGGNLPPSFVGL